MSDDQLRLAVVDDEAQIRELVRDVACEIGFHVEEVSDARSFDDVYCSTFEVIVLDLMMPGVDGIELMRSMAGHTRAQLVLMSGLGAKLIGSARQIAGTHGLKVSAILEKPFRASQLRAALLLASADAHAETRPSSVARRGAPKVSEAEFSQALAQSQLVVHLQPKWSLSGAGWNGVEALARWNHPEHGLLYPDAFIGLAEQPQWAEPFTQAILRIAIAETMLLQERTGFSGTLSVNLPPTAMSDPQLTDRVIAVLDEAGFDRARLMLEITETSIPADEGSALDILTRLRMRGIRLSIDDFGTGYSSLERLRSGAFDELKIDLNFVRDAMRELSARSIVENSISLGHSLGMSVVAEGVEDMRTMDWLRSLGCDAVQGYFVSRPKPLEDLCAWARSDHLSVIAAHASNAIGDVPAAQPQ